VPFEAFFGIILLLPRKLSGVELSRKKTYYQRGARKVKASLTQEKKVSHEAA
jgi:hypothetical protein